MTLWLGDIEADSVVTLPFSTHEAAGGNVAPSSALEIADIRVYKGSSATQRSSTAGMTMTSPFDSLTGVHMVEIDTSDNTDAGFWAAGNLYHILLAPDETVDGQTLTGVHLASFGIVYGAAAKQNTNIALILSRIGTPSNLGSGATVAGNLVDLEAQTDDIGAAGAGLTAVPWNAAWDAEVQSEAADAITAAALATAANLATLAGYVDTEVAAILAAVDTEVAAIKTKTDYLPSATAGAAGGLFIAGANAATSITTALTANITGNLSGSVGSVTGAVGSVTGAVGSVTGNVGGSVASVAANGITATSIATDAINAAAIKADAVTKIQTGLATPTNITAGTITTVTNLTNLPAAAALEATAQAILEDTGTTLPATLATIAGYVDTEVAAILAAVDTEVAAIKTKTDYLPSATAGAAGGVFIAGANAATSITTALTANITGDLSGSVGSVTGAVGSVTGAVGSVTGAVGSVTGNVGGNVVGSVGSVSGDTKQTADVAALITTVGVAGAGLTALATQASVNTIDDFLDTEIAAILADTNELQTDLVNGGRLDLLIDAIKAKTDNLPSDPADQSAVEAAITAATSPLATAAALATVDGIVDDILVDTGTTLPASLTTIDDYLDTEVAAIKAVADKLDTALVLDGAVYQFTANALELAPTGGSAPSAADIRAEIDANSTQLAAIVADTNELQTDLVNGGRLDLLVDAIKAKTDNLPSDPADESLLEAAITAAVSGLSTLTEANVRTAVGLASANLDTQLAALPTDSDVQTAATTALNAYDPPTNAEMVARTLAAASYFDPAADTVANVTTVATTTNLTNLPAAAALEATAQAILEDTGTTLPGTLATIAGYIDTEVAAILAAVDTEVAAILADTNELQTNQGNWVTADVSALATSAELAKVPKSDGSASWNATALAAINAQADTALADYDAPTKTEMDAAFTAIKGATWDSATDTLEALRDRGDAAWTTADVSDLPTNSELATALASADDAMLTAIADVPTVAEFEARTLVAASYATAANLATLSGYVDTEVAAILADTNELQTDLTNGGRLDLLIDAIKAKTDNLPAAPAATGDIPSAATIADAVLDEAVVGHVIAGSFSKAVVDILDDTSTSLPLAIASITPQSAADIRAEMDTNSTKLAAILADTNELQTDWANGGRLDLILDARASQTSVDDMPTNSELATALSGITASVDQQDIADALLLAPSGAAASGSAMDYLADILEDTGTTLPTAIADLPTAAEIDTELSGTHGDGSWEGEAAAGGGTGYYTDTVTDGASPLDGVQVQLYTAQDRVGLAYEAYTNALGVFEMWPDPGTYYRWLDLAGYSFTQDVEVEVTEP